jgi:hypothetical protein
LIAYRLPPIFAGDGDGRGDQVCIVLCGLAVGEGQDVLQADADVAAACASCRALIGMAGWAPAARLPLRQALINTGVAIGNSSL